MSYGTNYTIVSSIHEAEGLIVNNDLTKDQLVKILRGIWQLGYRQGKIQRNNEIIEILNLKN